MTAALKLRPAPVDLAREALALAITAKAEHERRMADLQARWRTVDEQVRAAYHVVDAAEATLAETEERLIAHGADPTTPAPILTKVEAQAAVDEAQQHVETLKSVRDRIAASISESERIGSAPFRDLALKDARSDVLRESPEVRAFIESFRRRARDLEVDRATIAMLGSFAIPEDLRGWQNIGDRFEPRQEWSAALSALTTDANAPLPSVT